MIPSIAINSQSRVATVLILIAIFIIVIPMDSVDALVSVSEKTVVLLYNKPKHVVTTHSEDDEKGRTNVYQDIMSMKGYVGQSSPPSQGFAAVTNMRRKLHAVGRLDAETTGLLLMTNDGGLIHHVTASHCLSDSTTTSSSATTDEQRHHLITKTYKVLIMGYHSDDETKSTPAKIIPDESIDATAPRTTNNNAPNEEQARATQPDLPQTHNDKPNILQILRTQGVDIGGAKSGGQCRPVEDLVVLDHPTAKSTSVLLTLSEGKNRQIRRMFHALGSGVMKLERVQIGKDLTLKGIEEEGQWRILSDDEVRTALQWEPRQLLEKNKKFKKKSNNDRRSSTNSKVGNGGSRRCHGTNRNGQRSRRRR